MNLNELLEGAIRCGVEIKEIKIIVSDKRSEGVAHFSSRELTAPQGERKETIETKISNAIKNARKKLYEHRNTNG